MKFRRVGAALGMIGCAGPASGEWSGACALVDPYAYDDGAYEITFDLDLVQRGAAVEGDGVGTWGDIPYGGTLRGDAVADDHLEFDLVSTQEDSFGTYRVVFGFDGQITGDRMTGACGVTSEGDHTLDGELTLRR